MATSNNGKSRVKYEYCMKNHGHQFGCVVVDGCGEFITSATGALLCDACGCHRSFHRRVETPLFHHCVPPPYPPQYDRDFAAAFAPPPPLPPQSHFYYFPQPQQYDVFAAAFASPPPQSQQQPQPQPRPQQQQQPKPLPPQYDAFVAGIAAAFATAFAPLPLPPQYGAFAAAIAAAFATAFAPPPPQPSQQAGNNENNAGDIKKDTQSEESVVPPPSQPQPQAAKKENVGDNKKDGKSKESFVPPPPLPPQPQSFSYHVVPQPHNTPKYDTFAATVAAAVATSLAPLPPQPQLSERAMNNENVGDIEDNAESEESFHLVE